ncbi:PREDICTED: ficolin-2-like [Amphimedon queenslandica]|uniref:Fibrinogen C-terminal domain-containing protein n=1 Tax=Amphimedon queenslandica TaxID=400682 RepID=A0AAN0IG50_AMPQE|nr:PREDICTED: ficolin-2-like [Amphimedon queenslandica]|eukprot:XP_003388288.1 PREDICTED: ficolin-2-like [Amphimedon queenslandica]
MAAMDEELNDENLNDRLNDHNLNNQSLNNALNNKKGNIARLHALVLFTLDTVITIFCLLFLIWFFLGTIITINQYNSDHQDTGCITCDCKDNRSNDSDCQETTIVKTSCIARDCKELYDQGHTCSGVYTIKPDKLPAFEVYCDMSSGGGWTVFQRRMDGSVNFYLKWADYRKGFGDLNGEFWLGLDKIHRLTATDNTSLRVDLEDFEGVSVFAHYSTFIVGDAHTKYTLTVGGYSGNAGDSLSGHDKMKFSTHDYDNDIADINCAIAYKGAWWYTEGHVSNLNARYLIGAHTTFADGVNWGSFKGHRYSLKVSEMKISRK